MIARIVPLSLVVLGCRGQSQGTGAVGDRAASPPRRDEAPVPLDAEPPIEYPASLAAQRQGGSVLLRLYIDSTGTVVPESTTVQESSGFPALDSAAIAGAPRVRYAPALRDGAPIPTVFLQPVTFRASRRRDTP